jgi:hypothetical protein
MTLHGRGKKLSLEIHDIKKSPKPPRMMLLSKAAATNPMFDFSASSVYFIPKRPRQTRLG